MGQIMATAHESPPSPSPPPLDMNDLLDTWNNSMTTTGNPLMESTTTEDWIQIINDFKERQMKYRSPLSIVLITFYLIVFLFGIVGNIGILDLVRRKHYTLGQTNNVMLINLCAADLMEILICYPMAINSAATNIWYLGGKFACSTLNYLQGISVTASTLSMMVLSIDRYLIVRHPTFIQKYDRNFVHLIHVSFVWIVALIISLPIIFVRTVRRIEIYGISIQFCIESWDSTSQRRLVSALNFTIVYLLPCAVQFACHSSVNRIIRSIDQNHNQKKHKSGEQVVKYHRADIRKRAFRIKSTENESTTNDSQLSIHSGFSSTHSNGYQRNTPSSNNNLPSFDSHGEIRSSRSRGSSSPFQTQNPLNTNSTSTTHGTRTVPTTRQIARIRFANLLIGMTLSFIFCWAPYNLISLWLDLFPDERLLPYLSFALLLGHSHSAINPVIYWYLNKASRAKLRHLVQSRTQLIQMKRLKTKTDLIYLQSNLPPQNIQQQGRLNGVYQHAHQRLTMDHGNGGLKGSIAMLGPASGGGRVLSDGGVAMDFPLGLPNVMGMHPLMPKNCTRL